MAITKNPAAVALGKLRKGIVEQPSQRKIKAALANLQKARAALANRVCKQSIVKSQ